MMIQSKFKSGDAIIYKCRDGFLIDGIIERVTSDNNKIFARFDDISNNFGNGIGDAPNCSRQFDKYRWFGTEENNENEGNIKDIYPITRIEELNGNNLKQDNQGYKTIHELCEVLDTILLDNYKDLSNGEGIPTDITYIIGQYAFYSDTLLHHTQILKNINVPDLRAFNIYEQVTKHMHISTLFHDNFSHAYKMKLPVLPDNRSQLLFIQLGSDDDTKLTALNNVKFLISPFITKIKLHCFSNKPVIPLIDGDAQEIIEINPNDSTLKDNPFWNNALCPWVDHKVLEKYIPVVTKYIIIELFHTSDITRTNQNPIFDPIVEFPIMFCVGFYHFEWSK